MSVRTFVSSAKRRADPENWLNEIESECTRMRVQLDLVKPAKPAVQVEPPPTLDSQGIPLPPWVEKIKKSNRIRGVSRYL